MGPSQEELPGSCWCGTKPALISWVHTRAFLLCCTVHPGAMGIFRVFSISCCFLACCLACHCISLALKEPSGRAKLVKARFLLIFFFQMIGPVRISKQYLCQEHAFSIILQIKCIILHFLKTMNDILIICYAWSNPYEKWIYGKYARVN